MESLLACRCGQVRGCLQDASPKTVHRVVCYCDDCQAAALHLGRADLLDAHGGSDVIQVGASVLRFDVGAERIGALRLTEKGLYRWYASCCNTPLGNTFARAVAPLIGGVPVALFAASLRDELFGKPRGALRSQFAIGGVAQGLQPFGLKQTLQYLPYLFRWKKWPHPFFDRASGARLYPTLKTVTPTVVASS